MPAHDAHDRAADEVGGERDVDGGVVEGAGDGEVGAVPASVEPVADRLVDGRRPSGRADRQLVLGVEPLPQRDERQRSGRVGDDHSGVDRTRPLRTSRGSPRRNKQETRAGQAARMSRYRLRVELPDLPGALAKVATVISDLDGDVVSIDVHELDGHQVVDELVVEVLTDLDGRVLGAALEEADAGILLSCAPATARPEPVVEALGWARELAGQERSVDGGADPRRRVPRRRRCGSRRSTRRARCRPGASRWRAAHRSCNGRTTCPSSSAGGRRRRCGCSRSPTVSRTRAASRSSPVRVRCASPRPRSRGSTR